MNLFLYSICKKILACKVAMVYKMCVLFNVIFVVVVDIVDLLKQHWSHC